MGDLNGARQADHEAKEAVGSAGHEEKFRAVAEAAPDAIVSADSQGVLTKPVSMAILREAILKVMSQPG